MALDVFNDFMALLDVKPIHPRHIVSLFKVDLEELNERGLDESRCGFSWYYYADYIDNTGGCGYVELDMVNKRVGRFGNPAGWERL